MHYSCWSGQLLVAKFIVSRGADVNRLNRLDNTPLHYACEHGDVAIAKLLIKNGANVNAGRDDGWTPLHMACYLGHFDLAEVLFWKGTDKNLMDNEARISIEVPVHAATQHEREAMKTRLRSLLNLF
jgi:ankyrin repeat protein